MASHTFCRSCLQALRTQTRQQFSAQTSLLTPRAVLPSIRSYASDSDKHSTQHSKPPPPRQEGLPKNPSPTETRHPPPPPPPSSPGSGKEGSRPPTASGPSSGSTSHPNSDKDPIQASTTMSQTPKGRPTNPAPPARNAAPPPPSSSRAAHPDGSSAPPSASASNPAYYQRPIDATQSPSATKTSKKFAADPSPPARNAAPTPPPPPPPSNSRFPNPQNAEQQYANPLASFAKQVRRSDALKSTTEPYIAYGGTEDLFKECARQCDYTVPAVLKQPPEPAPKNAAGEDVGEGTGWWFVPNVPAGMERHGHGGVSGPGLGLDVTFNSWAQVMYLHMYVLTVRLRCFPAQHARVWHQHLLDHFFYAAEDRMTIWHGMVARSVRNKYLKDLWQQWRGVLLSYDEGLIKGDAVLATAVWRNVFKADERVDIADLALVTAYLRAQLKMLDGIGDEQVSSGDVAFGDPNALRKLLDKESSGTRESLTVEELKEHVRKVE